MLTSPHANVPVCVCVCSPSGKIDLSYIDPVIIGRSVFSVANELMCGVAGHIQDVLCFVLDTGMDVVKGFYSLVYPAAS